VKGPILGIDLGARRIGLAISDAEGRIAFPRGHLERSGLKRDLSALRGLAEEHGARCIVVGLPLQLDGREGTAARAARDFARALGEVTSVPIELVDERLTTREAERALRDAPRKTRRARKQVVDAMAATLLLRSWLDAHPASDPKP
jgi:putative Holliday junction resolvase